MSFQLLSRTLRVYRYTVILLLLPTLLPAADRDNWISLFDGKTLQGWKHVGGKGRYEVKDGAIVGTIAASEFGSFLITDAEYRDFVLEAEFKADWGLNSGLQFRAKMPPGYPKERMQGYQYEIDPTDRGITGALNGDIPGKKGHGLLPTSHGGPPRDAWIKERGNGKWLIPDAWNSLRIECRGPHMKLWLNGKLTVEYDESTFASGRIGLQVPQAPENSPLIGKKIAFRNLRLQQLK
jgi:hypothetical protein